jgi:RNA polymerase sigma-70 factor (ECF subfamily)
MEREQLNEEFERHRGQLRSFVFRITASKADSEDIVQDTYIKASRKLETFRGASSLKTWLFAIASNIARDHLRSKKRWPTNAMDLAKAETLSDPGRYLSQFQKINASPFGAFELREHINFCFTCIGKTLPIEQQMVVLLKEVFEFKVAEISEIIGETEGVVKHALLDGRNTMNDIFEQRCSLVNKNGVCHQCSELNGVFNPKQDFQEEKMKVGLHNDSGDKSKDDLFALRADIVKAIDSVECNGRDLHFFHFDHVANVLNSSSSR